MINSLKKLVVEDWLAAEVVWCSGWEVMYIEVVAIKGGGGREVGLP